MSVDLVCRCGPGARGLKLVYTACILYCDSVALTLSMFSACRRVRLIPWARRVNVVFVSVFSG